MEIAAAWELAKQTVFQTLLHVHVKAVHACLAQAWSYRHPVKLMPGLDFTIPTCYSPMSGCSSV